MDSAALIELAGSHGFRLTSRMLETFRANGLLPRTERLQNRGRKPTWVYPEGSDQQLLTLLQWRDRTTDSDVLRVLLWLAGHPIDVHTVRDTILRQLQQVQAIVEGELELRAVASGLDADTPEGRHAAITRLAEEAAGRKGKNTVLPRRKGVTLAERTDAMAMLLTAMLGDDLPDSDEQARVLERALGLSAGRRAIEDIPPWLTGPANEIFTALAACNPTELQDVVVSADPEVWDLARPVVHALLTLLPTVVTLMKAMTGQANPAGWGALEGLDDNPAIVMLLIPLVLHVWQTDPAGPQEVARSLQNGLQPRAKLEELMDLPKAQLDNNLRRSRLAADKVEGLHRVIEAQTEGRLTPLPARPARKKPPSRRA